MLLGRIYSHRPLFRDFKTSKWRKIRVNRKIRRRKIRVDRLCLLKTGFSRTFSGSIFGQMTFGPMSIVSVRSKICEFHKDEYKCTEGYYCGLGCQTGTPTSSRDCKDQRCPNPGNSDSHQSSRIHNFLGFSHKAISLVLGTFISIFRISWISGNTCRKIAFPFPKSWNKGNGDGNSESFQFPLASLVRTAGGTSVRWTTNVWRDHLVPFPVRTENTNPKNRRIPV